MSGSPVRPYQHGEATPACGRTPPHDRKADVQTAPSPPLPQQRPGETVQSRPVAPAAPVLADWAVNAGDRRIQLALALFRASRLLRTSGRPYLRLAGRPVSSLYMVLVRWT